MEARPEPAICCCSPRWLHCGLAAPFFIYPVFLMKVLCFALFACAFNLLVGYVGLLSFGHAMFFGFAAYIAGYSVKVLGWPTELGILAGVAVAAALGSVAGAIAIRRQGIYFAMVTLALAQMVYFFCVQAKFTGGEDGIQAIPRRPLFGLLPITNDFVLLLCRAGGLLRRLPDHLAHHPFAVRPGAEGDPRERAARNLARLRGGPLQADRLRAVGRAGGSRRAPPRPSCSSSPRSPMWPGRCRARSC